MALHLHTAKQFFQVFLRPLNDQKPKRGSTMCEADPKGPLVRVGEPGQADGQTDTTKHIFPDAGNLGSGF